MKIIRHQTEQGPAYAALLPDGRAQAIEGNILGDYRVTERAAKVGRLLAPIAPPCILAIGFNYAKHAAEGGKAPPARPVWFTKLPNTVQHPDEPIRLPRNQPTEKPDFEAELAIVIGKDCCNARRENALDFVLGYTCANDVSARDWQKELGGGQFNHGKGFDTFCPLGPAIVTKEEIPDPQQLRVRSILNGTVMQDGFTGDMTFDVRTIIAFLSADKTLPAGTVILTGTPDGVGFARTPPVWLKAGDTIAIEIEKIGTLTNPVV